MDTKEILEQVKNIKWNGSWAVVFTFSKIMAFLILVSATYVEVTVTKSGVVFLASLQTITLLLMGKQYYDMKKETKKEGLIADVEITKLKNKS